MEKSSTIIMLGIILAVALPFVIIAILKRNRRKKVIQRFNAFSVKANLKISSEEILENGNIIALDPDKGKIVYFIAKESHAEPHIIDVANVQKCRVVTTDGSKESRSGDKSRANRLDLVITMNGPSGGEIALEFFSRTGLSFDQHDYSLVQKWVDALNSCQTRIKTA